MIRLYAHAMYLPVLTPPHPCLQTAWKPAVFCLAESLPPPRGKRGFLSAPARLCWTLPVTNSYILYYQYSNGPSVVDDDQLLLQTGHHQEGYYYY